MAIDQSLVSKGRSQPRYAVAQQGKVSVALAKKYEAELAGNGWSAADTTALAADVGTLETTCGAQYQAKDAAKAATAVESTSAEGAMGYIRILVRALPRVIRENPSLGVSVRSFAGAGELRGSSPAIARYLVSMRPLVVKLSAQLTPYFGGKDPVALLDGVKTSLDTADTAQETARKTSPQQTAAAYEITGKVLRQLEDLNRAGKSAFEGNPSLQRMFNKDLIERARRRRAPAAETPAESTPENDTTSASAATPAAATPTAATSATATKPAA